MQPSQVRRIIVDLNRTRLGDASMGDSDFKLTANVTPNSKHIHPVGFDEYVGDANVKAFLKTLNSHEFSSLTISNYPSSFDHVIRNLKMKFGYRLDMIQDAIFYYGLIELWNILSKSEIKNILQLFDKVRYHIEIPQSTSRDIYDIEGDCKRKVFKISQETSALVTEIAMQLNVTKSSVGMAAMLLTFEKSEHLKNNYTFIFNKYLFGFQDKIKRTIKNYSEENLQTFIPYSKYIYSTYITELTKKNPNMIAIKMLYEILYTSKRYGCLEENLVHYNNVMKTMQDVIESNIEDIKVVGFSDDFGLDNVLNNVPQYQYDPNIDTEKMLDDAVNEHIRDIPVNDAVDEHIGNIPVINEKDIKPYKESVSENNDKTNIDDIGFIKKATGTILKLLRFK